MIAHSSFSRFSIGVPVIATRRRADSVRSARARFVCGFFTSCASSMISRSQSTSASASTSRVAMSYDVTTTSTECALRCSSSFARRSLPVMQMHAQPRREAMHLRHPLPRHAHRAHDERRPERLRPGFLALRHEHRDRLHRLPQAHVVGQDRPDPEIAEHPQPPVPLLLEREQVVPHPRRRPARPEARVLAGEQLVERAVELHRAQLEPRLVGLEARHRPHELDEADDPGAAARGSAARASRRPRAPPASGPRPARPGSSPPRARAAPRP